MDPVSGLSLACNIIQLVETAIKCGAAVVKVYNSVDGLSNAHKTVEREADGIADVVGHLRDHQAQLQSPGFDSEIRKLTSRIIGQCDELRGILDECRPRKRGNVSSAGRATLKSLGKANDIQRLQRELDSSHKRLNLLITIRTQVDVERILHSLDSLGLKDSQITANLGELEEKLKVIQSSIQSDRISQSAEDATQTFRGAQELVADGMILELLHFENLGQRFQDLKDPHENTLTWIFEKPELIREREPELSMTFPDWLRRGSGIFHIAGKPGSGKSMLMKYLCRHPDTESLLAEWAGDRELVFAKFFFWRMGTDKDEKSLNGLIRALLYEVLCKAPTLAKSLFPVTRAKIMQEPSRGRRGSDLLAAEIKDAFTQLVRLSASSEQSPSMGSIRICFFIDGLDEFDDSGVNESHGQLVDKLLQWTENSDGNVKLCVSSRVQQPFIGRFDSSQRIALHRLTEQDIERFIRDRLEEHTTFRKRKEQEDRECEELVQDILRAAEGVFLWVALVLKSLERGLNALIPISHLRTRVARTPSDLEALLSQILESIDDGYRGSVDMLLAAILRSYRVLLSPEGRDPGHAAFDAMWTNDVNSADPRNAEFYLRPFGCFSILAAGDARKQISAQLGVVDLDFHEWFRENMSDDEVRKTIENAVLSRCNGLIEVTDESTVKFIHRSIPEVLEEYLKRQTTPSRQLDDHQITLAMAWAYRMDVQLEAAMEPMQAQHSSLINFLLCKVDIGNGIIGVENGADRVHNGYNELEHDELHFISSSPASSFLPGFLHRLRQMRFEDRGEDIFRVLLSIDQTQYETRGFGCIGIQGRRPLTGGRATREQMLCLLDLSAFVGYDEFVDWAFRGRRVSDLETRLFLIMSRAIKREMEPDATLDVMETVFSHGFSASAEFPNGAHFAGKPLWHAVLMKSLRSAEPGAWSKVMELWLRNGADPGVRFLLRKGLNMILMPGIMNSMAVAPAVAYIRGLREGSIADEHLPQGMSLGTFITLLKFPNRQVLLDLIDGGIETDGSKKADMISPELKDEKKAESESGSAQNPEDISQQPLEREEMSGTSTQFFYEPGRSRPRGQTQRPWIFLHLLIACVAGLFAVGLFGGI